MSTLRAPDPPLFDEHVVLRPLAEKHVPVVERALADLEIQRWFDDRGLTARDVVERAAARWAATEAAEFATIDEGECVGSIWLNLSLENRAGVGYWLLAHARGKGLATSALLLVARWAFDALGVKRIGLNADPRNVASVRVAARVASHARPGEVLVSSTVKDLVAGSEIEFEDRGLSELKGIPGKWRLFAVARG
jgi:RimJ/RimL family protein N-acetyltransferase